jgi:hypothetical protein
MSKVSYEIDRDKELTFNIKNYNTAYPFSSFFPGIAGTMGIPLWCFYVNRGQCIASFGFESKDGAILEFQPANKAYRLTPLYGFRTFIKTKNELYEPFRAGVNHKYDSENLMKISPYDLTIREINKTLGLECEVNYFTLPEEPVGALIRILKLKNISNSEMEPEIIDGLPQIMPYGLDNEAMKNMSRTIEAWYRIDNLTEKTPFYRLSTSFKDVAEVKAVNSGHFYFSFIEDGKLLDVIVEPEDVFGDVSDFSFPEKFFADNFTLPQPIFHGNKTPSALSYAHFKLKPSEEKSVITFIGRADSLERLKGLVKVYARRDFVMQKSKENELLIKSIMDNCFVYSALQEFNFYARQSFLDNVLRGGLPVTLSYERKKDVIYLFSRKHGDLERDYNFFWLDPHYFSQGNANYRDINQNRRNDIYFNPDVGYSNIIYFVNLIQLDGYNPLVIKGVNYIFDSGKINQIDCWVEKEAAIELKKILENPFIPFSIIKLLENYDFKLKKGNLTEFISFLLVNSRKVENADFGEGYWIDHWFYNLDLIESFESIFPDKMKELLLEINEFSYYDSYEFVLPRSERYVLTSSGVKQYRFLQKDEEKLKLIKSREIEPHKVRKSYGRGEIYYTTLFSKLLTLSVVKLSTLDPENTGIEMEAGKPGWNDSLNGLPAIFGSSVNETIELKRLILNLKNWTNKYNLANREVAIPVEVYDFLNNIKNILARNLQGEINEFECWDLCSLEREMYRERVRMGIDGKEIKVKIVNLEEFFNLALKKLEMAIEKAFDGERKIYHTYFYYELADYKVEKENGKEVIKPKKFVRKFLPAFLEVFVHYLKIEKDASIYEAVKNTQIYDRKLKMYKLNEPLENVPMEMGRVKAFTPGWLENESVFLHMEYKYLLELLKSGNAGLFYQEAKNCLIPFLKPEVYKRSIFENVSFIASSANPDERIHGMGFAARLSGSTSEFYNMLIVMAFGSKPFYLDNENKLCLKFEPKLASFLFTKKESEVSYYTGEKVEKISVPANCFVVKFLKDTFVFFFNEKRLDTFGENSVKVKKYILYGSNGEKTIVENSFITQPYSLRVREGFYGRIDVVMG